MDKRQARRIFSRVGWGITVLMVVWLAGAALLSFLLSLAAPQLLTTGWMTWLFNYVPLYCFALPLMLLIFRKIPETDRVPAEKKRVSLAFMLAFIAAGWAIVLVTNMLTQYVAVLIELVKGSEVNNPLEETTMSSSLWATLVAACLVGPMIEEYIFRKKLRDKLIIFGPATYILISSILFALFHANIYQFFYAFLLGVMFATLAYTTGTIKYSLIAHMIINFLGAGGSNLILYYGGDIGYGFWALFLILVAIAGIVLIIWWLVARRRSIFFAPAETPLPAKGAAILNPGMLVCVIAIGLLTIYTMLV